MSAFAPKVDICGALSHVRQGPFGDMEIDIDFGPLGAMSSFATAAHKVAK
jgi:hypothetical protein